MLGLAAVSILIDQIGIDTAGFDLLGIRATPGQLTTATIWVLLVLWISLLVNWLSDLTSLGRWNQAMYTNWVETIMDGNGKIKSRLEFLIVGVERMIKIADEKGDLPDTGSNSYWAREIAEINKSFLRFDMVAWWYVCGWGFGVLTLTAFVAGMLLLQGQ